MEQEDTPLSLGAFRPLPPELASVQTGRIEIDGKRYTKWREVAIDPAIDSESCSAEEWLQNVKEVPVSDEEMERLVKQYGAVDWYQWSTENWGTKWDVCQPEVMSQGPRTFEVLFDTAWSPPLGWLEYVSKLFPQLTFSLAYAEGGCCVYGLEVCKGGESTGEGYCVEGSFWVEAENDEQSGDIYDRLSDGCRAHLETYVLHIGG